MSHNIMSIGQHIFHVHPSFNESGYESAHMSTHPVMFLFVRGNPLCADKGNAYVRWMHVSPLPHEQGDSQSIHKALKVLFQCYNYSIVHLLL